MGIPTVRRTLLDDTLCRISLKFIVIFLFLFFVTCRGLGPLEFYDSDFVFVTMNLGHILLDLIGR